MKKCANEWSRAFSKEEVQMAKEHRKKCSLSLPIKEIQNKTTLRFHLTPVRTATIKNTNNNKYWPGWEEKNPHTLLVGIKLVQPLWKNSMEAP
jgi:hypothetical protein